MKQDGYCHQLTQELYGCTEDQEKDHYLFTNTIIFFDFNKEPSIEMEKELEKLKKLAR